MVERAMTLSSEPIRSFGDRVVPTSREEPARCTVLVVDDSRFVRASLVRSLSSAPSRAILQADGGEHAWRMLEQDPTIDVVLTDLSMPDTDGFELLRRVRASGDSRLRDLPVAVLSGADEPDLRDRARALGADRFEVKGQGLEALRDWIDAQRDMRAVPPGTPAPAATASEQAQPVPSEPRSDATSGAAGTESSPAPAVGGPESGTIDARSAPDVAPSADPAPVPGAVWLVVRAEGAPGWVDRLRRGVRLPDALRVDPPERASLRIPAGEALALRLALRLGLLAAGPAAVDGGAGARVTLSIGEPAAHASGAVPGVAAAAVGEPPGLHVIEHVPDGVRAHRLRWPVVRLLLRPGTRPTDA